VLARLDRIDGIERSYTNRAGTLLWVSVAPSADPERVAADTIRVLGEQRNPTQLLGAELVEALAKEEWRDSERVGELSAIEFRTLALRGLPWLAGVLAFLLLGRRLWIRFRGARIKKNQGGSERAGA
jgi:hypothetical protein